MTECRLKFYKASAWQTANSRL